VAVHLRFDHVRHQQFKRHEQRHAGHRQRPAGVDGGHEHGDHDARHHDAEVGHEAQQAAQRAPQRRVRHAGRPTAAPPISSAEGHVDDELREEEARHARGGVGQRAHRAADLGLAGEPDQAVAQGFVFQQK
jgi:hypothetical protein